MSYKIEYAAASIIGLIRKNNEDNLYIDGYYLPETNSGLEDIRTGVLKSDDQPIAAVFDGMGGMLAGETAAYLSAKTMADAVPVKEKESFFRSLRKMLINSKKTVKMTQEDDQELIERMNQSVFDYALEQKISGMGATLVMLRFLQNEILATNVGDSSIFCLEEGKLEKISEDHVLKIPGMRKAPITQFIGMDLEEYAMKPSVKSKPIKVGTQFLLCTDGVTDMLSEEKVEAILNEKTKLEEKVRTILDQVLEAGARDNTTMILCRIVEG